MDLRSSYYCVSVPGQSQWVKDADKPAGLDAALQGMLQRNTHHGQRGGTELMVLQDLTADYYLHR